MGNFVGCKSERLTGVTPRYRIKKFKSQKKLIKKVELRNLPYCIHQNYQYNRQYNVHQK